MTIRTFIILLLISLFVTSCKMGSFANDKHLYNSPVPSVGVIGFIEEKILSESFIPSGAPLLNEKIKLSVQKKKMTKSSIKRANVSIVQKTEKVQNRDSVQLESYFYQIEIGDKVGLLRELNTPVNHDLKKYLEVTQSGVMVTSIGIYFTPELSSKLDEALEVYLISNNSGSLSLEMLRKDSTKEVLHFSDGLILDYHYSAFCWTEDYKGNLVISAFRDPEKSCPGRTVKNPARLEREDIFETLR